MSPPSFRESLAVSRVSSFVEMDVARRTRCTSIYDCLVVNEGALVTPPAKHLPRTDPPLNAHTPPAQTR